MITPHTRYGGKVVALAGGVGGARMADGLMRALPKDALTVVVNTGDDFSHFGLSISPDLDTQLYTLSQTVNSETGWGRADDGGAFMETVAQLGGPTWFHLGDRDLALHAERTRRLAQGQPLSRITADFAAAFGLGVHLLPMTDDKVCTVLDTDAGRLSMQNYFVKARCQPMVRGIAYEGAAQARCAPGVLDALADPALTAVVICPSNPYLSIDPMLAVPGLREALHARSVPVVAVSPIVNGAAVKGPLARLMAGFGLTVAPSSIAAHYDRLIDGFVLDHADRADTDCIAQLCHTAATLMPDARSRTALAQEVLDFAARIASKAAEAVL